MTCTISTAFGSRLRNGIVIKLALVKNILVDGFESLLTIERTSSQTKVRNPRISCRASGGEENGRENVQ
jgi:hypothetical protein